MYKSTLSFVVCNLFRCIFDFVFTADGHIQYHIASSNAIPKRILVIRLQATGDVIITLPYIQSLRRQLSGGTQIDLLVREECKNIPMNLNLFDTIYVLQGGRNSKLQLLHFIFSLWPKLFFKKYDVLLDLQNHKLSLIMRILLRFGSYTIFDRTSTNYAGDRYKNTINALNLPKVKFEKLDCFKPYSKSDLFKKFGLKESKKYIVLNPAGAFENRNWKLENYVQFAQLFLKDVNSNYQFLIIGIEKVEAAGKYFQQQLGDKLINLVGKTTQMEAMLLLKNVDLVVSEDSGLFHMAYVVGTPTIGIFGSTRNDWTNPDLGHTFCFNSSDMECGNCMLEKCKFSEIKCLERLKPFMLIPEVTKLLNINN